MELLQLIYFRDAAKLENFSRVAKKYFVAQPAVSHAISKLEDELGIKLFNRCGNKVTLNDYGHAFYEDVDAAIERLERGKKRVANLKENTVQLSMREGTVALIPMIAAFKKEHPEIEVTFPTTVADHPQIDLLILARPFEKEEEYITTPLFVEKIIIALPAESPLAKKQALTIEDIRNQPIIGLHRGFKMYRQISAYFELNEYVPNIVVSSSNNATIAEYVKNGFGIAFFPELSWSGVLGEGIVARPFADFDSRRTIYIAYKKDTSLNDAAKKFIEFGKAYFENKQK